MTTKFQFLNSDLNLNIYVKEGNNFKYFLPQQSFSRTQSKMRLRVKSKSFNEIVTIDDNATLSELNHQLQKSLSSIKNGFPPKAIDISDVSSQLSELGIKNGDQLIVEVDEADDKAATSNAAADVTAPKAKMNSYKKEIATIDDTKLTGIPCGNGHIVLREIPDDNSCLFNSISYSLFGSDFNYSSPPIQLRNIVKETIMQHPEIYSETVLEKIPNEYVNWILRPTSWGGAIEIGILSEYFNLQIIAIEVETGKFIKFNESSDTFCCLLYSGIHYDAIAFNTNPKIPESDKCVFNINSQEGQDFIQSCAKLGDFLKSKNYATNTTKFKVMCNVCKEVLVGERGAAKHASETGHLDFGEVTKQHSQPK